MRVDTDGRPTPLVLKHIEFAVELFNPKVPSTTSDAVVGSITFEFNILFLDAITLRAVNEEV